MRVLTPALALLFACAFSSPAAAQISAKEATKQLKQAVKNELTTLKLAVKTDVAVIKTQIKSATIAAKQGEANAAAAINLFDDLSAFQASMGESASAASDIYTTMTPILNDIAPEEEFEGIYPPGFSVGDGGPLDDYVAAANKLLASPYPGLRKQLLKYSKQALKKSELFVNVRLEESRQVRERSSNVGVTVGWSSREVTIDTLMCVSRSDIETDLAARLLVAGSAPASLGSVTIDLAGASSPESDIAIVDERYSEEFVDFGVGFPRGNYIVRVLDDDGGAQVNSAIGMR